MAGILLRGVRKSFGTVPILHGLDLEVVDGEFVVLVGPSGCGKSTTLRIIAGLEEASAGEVLIGGRPVTNLPPKARNIAMVFQNYAIYPHMTVRRNIGFGLRTASLPAAEKRRRVEEAAGTLGLTEFLDRRPSELSGGQRQRVAIGRAMVRDPAAFLFDEPLSNLDAQLRTQMRLEIKKLHSRLGATTVFVTHDQVEAMTLADRIVVMRGGHIMQIGSPTELYSRPANVFTARFIGSPAMNLLPGRIAVAAMSATVDLDGIGAFHLPPGRVAPGCGTTQILLGIRPDDLLHTTDPDAGTFVLDGVVSALEPLGPETLVHAEHRAVSFVGKAPGRRVLRVGERIRLAADMQALHLFDAATEMALGTP